MNVDNMLEKLATDTVGYMKFCLIYAKESGRAICLVEGKDATYYRVRVNSICEGSRSKFIECGGKKQVIATRELISKNEYYKQGKILAFVDKDFDDTLNNALIYETPCHSIENFYTSEVAFRTILEDEFKMNDDEADFEKCVDLYISTQRKFHEKMLELNAWIICQMNKSKNEFVELNLNKQHNNIMREFITISLTDVQKNYNQESIRIKFPKAAQVTSEEIEDMIASLSSLNYQQVFRGKYEIDFLEKFLTKLILVLNDKNLYRNYFSKKRNISFRATDSELISQISQHAETPQCLTEYIKGIWSNDLLVGVNV